MNEFNIKNNISLCSIIFILSNAHENKSILICELADGTMCLTFNESSGYIIYDPAINKITEIDNQFLYLIKACK
jgi:hypothetical protein